MSAVKDWSRSFVYVNTEINKADPEGLSTKDETEEEAINRIQSRFEILNEMTEAVATKKVRAMIVSGPAGVGKSYGITSQLQKAGMFEAMKNEVRWEVVKGATSAIGLYKKLYQYSLLEEKSPNAIPSFQTKMIFRYFDENISEPKNFLSKLIT